MHSHVVNTNVAWLSTDPPGAELIYTHDSETSPRWHFLILGVDGLHDAEEAVASLLDKQGLAVEG